MTGYTVLEGIAQERIMTQHDLWMYMFYTQVKKGQSPLQRFLRQLVFSAHNFPKSGDALPFVVIILKTYVCIYIFLNFWMPYLFAVSTLNFMY